MKVRLAVTLGADARRVRSARLQRCVPARRRTLADVRDHVLQRSPGLQLGRRHRGVRVEHERCASAVRQEPATGREGAARDPLVQGRRRCERTARQRPLSRREGRDPNRPGPFHDDARRRARARSRVGARSRKPDLRHHELVSRGRPHGVLSRRSGGDVDLPAVARRRCARCGQPVRRRRSPDPRARVLLK